MAPSRQTVIRSAMPRSSRRSRRLHGRLPLGRGAHSAGGGHGVVKPQVSGVCRVRVRGKYLHWGMRQVSDLGIHVRRCASPVFATVEELVGIQLAVCAAECTLMPITGRSGGVGAGTTWTAATVMCSWRCSVG